jgi:glycosyltransferase involved in cell wall biosynthesis
MRLTFLLPDVRFTTRSGGYRVHYEMAERLSTRGHQVVVLHKTNSRRVWLRSKLWPLLRHFTPHDFVPWFKFSSGLRLLVVMTVSRRTVPDTDVFVFTQWKTMRDLPKLPRAAASVALVWDYESWAEGGSQLREAMRHALSQPELSLVAGSVAVEVMLDSMHLRPAAKISPGLDLGVFRCGCDPRERGDTIGFLNRPGPHRGIPDVLDALSLVRDARAQTRIVVAGQSEADLPPWAEWRPTPTDSDLVAFYNELAVFVLPSHAEGLGLPALEAMACGAAIVTTDNGGSREFARDEQNSLIVPTQTPPAMSAAIIRLLSDAKLRWRIAEAGLETAANFTWERAVDDAERLLERVAG